MMVMGPAGYRFGDYWKLGLPMVGVFFVVAIGLVPLAWPLITIIGLVGAGPADSSLAAGR